MANEIAELNRIRLEEDLSVEALASAIGMERSTLHRLLFQPDRKPYDRTLHKVRRFLDARKGVGKRRQVARAS